MQTQVRGQSPIQRAGHVRQLLQRQAPDIVLVDTNMRPGAWVVVRGATEAEMAVAEGITDRHKTADWAPA